MPRLSGRTVLRNNNPPATEEKTQDRRGKALPSPPLPSEGLPLLSLIINHHSLGGIAESGASPLHDIPGF